MIQAGQRYQINLPVGARDPIWDVCPRTIEAVDEQQVRYRLQDGRYFERSLSMITKSIREGMWVLDVPAILAIPEGI